jgi:hypothetical protein
MYRQAVVHLPSRLAILANEGRAMGDDELNLHLLACVKLSGRGDVQFLDPLLAGSWMQSGSVDKVQEWIHQFPDMTCIVSVVPAHEHWMPVVWTVGLSEVQVSMWEHTEVDID